MSPEQVDTEFQNLLLHIEQVAKRMGSLYDLKLSAGNNGENYERLASALDLFELMKEAARKAMLVDNPSPAVTADREVDDADRVISYYVTSVIERVPNLPHHWAFMHTTDDSPRNYVARLVAAIHSWCEAAGLSWQDILGRAEEIRALLASDREGSGEHKP